MTYSKNRQLNVQVKVNQSQKCVARSRPDSLKKAIFTLEQVTDLIAGTEAAGTEEQGSEKQVSDIVRSTEEEDRDGQLTGIVETTVEHVTDIVAGTEPQAQKNKAVKNKSQ